MSPLQAFIVFKAIDQATSTIRKITSATNLQIDRLKNLQLGAFAVGGAFALLTKKMVDTASSIDSATAPLRTVVTSTMGGLNKSIEAMKSAATQWSAVHSQSIEEFLSASYQMSSAGLNDIQAIEGTRKALALATATMGDNNEAANLLALAYNNFGDNTRDVAGEMGRLGDVLAVTQNTFQITNLGQLTEGLKYASASALAAKISFEQMNTVVGMLNSVGLQGSMAGTSFANAVTQMTKASESLGFALVQNAEGGLDFIGTLENIKKATEGMSAIEMQDALNKAFGQEASRGIALLLGQLDKLKESYKQVANATGKLESAQKAMEDVFAIKSKIFGNNIKLLSASIGTHFVGALSKLLDIINPILASVSSFVSKHPAISGTIAMLIGGIMGLATVIGILATVTTITKTGMGAMFIKEFAYYSEYIKIFIGKILALIGITQAWNRAQQAMTIASAFGVKGFALLTTGVKAFTASLLANPIFLIVAGIIAVGAAIYIVSRKLCLVIG
ncbi:phage tail tape measure protein [Thermospira aquatica]|uniref:Phage tail tape measure protein n=1 Tax=Thermospira aquatica TaxID=2828656 RepID=A0AAX3BE10_9SPIR|nr:phage tail tape measure protein [Thermospira aquatica]URA10534.1 phage tail tape measure protein [Thermospira aquatica]